MVKTVHTGNHKHRTVPEGGSYLARRYGQAHGFNGDLGGWIYDGSGQHVAHGWGQFYLKYAFDINRWAAQQAGVPLLDIGKNGGQVMKSAAELAAALYKKPAAQPAA